MSNTIPNTAIPDLEGAIRTREAEIERLKAEAQTAFKTFMEATRAGRILAEEVDGLYVSLDAVHLADDPAYIAPERPAAITLLLGAGRPMIEEV